MTAPRGKALIVTLGRSRGSLAAARALCRAGWEVGIGAPQGDGMVAASRACESTHVAPRRSGDGTETSVWSVRDPVPVLDLLRPRGIRILRAARP